MCRVISILVLLSILSGVFALNGTDSGNRATEAVQTETKASIERKPSIDIEASKTNVISEPSIVNSNGTIVKLPSPREADFKPQPLPVGNAAADSLKLDTNYFGDRAPGAISNKITSSETNVTLGSPAVEKNDTELPTSNHVESNGQAIGNATVASSKSNYLLTESSTILTTSTDSNRLTSATDSHSAISKVPSHKLKFPKNKTKFYNAKIGEITQLDCSDLDIRYHPLNYTWFRDGEVQPEMYNQPYWKIEAKDINQTGSYTCEARNKDGSKNFTFYFTVLSPKNIYVNQCVDRSVKISCPRAADYHNMIYLYQKFTNGSLISLKNGTEKDFPYKVNDVVYETSSFICNSTTIDKQGEIITRNIDVTVEKCDDSIPGDFLTLKIFVWVVIATLPVILVTITMCIKRSVNRAKKKKGVEFESVLVEKPCFKRLSVKKNKTDEYCDHFLFDIEIEVCYSNNTLYESSLIYGKYIIPADPSWELPEDQIQLGEIIGKGAFGKVYRAEAYGVSKPNVKTTVAVKTLKVRSNELEGDNELKNLYAEMETMKRIGKHKNVISLLKCCTSKMYLVMEYAGRGSLKDFLEKCRRGNEFNPVGGPINQTNALEFSLQIAKGMEYLSTRKYVHRDLAARNVLVTDDYTMKIADFGLTRSVIEKDYYRKTSDGGVPYKWMAPEALSRMIFTTRSDVWSFGIVMWEIYTMGSVPYVTIDNHEMERKLKNGTRLVKPDNCSIQPFCLMRECWSYTPEERPSFCYLVEQLRSLLINPGISLEVQYSNTESSDDSDTESSRGMLY